MFKDTPQVRVKNHKAMSKAESVSSISNKKPRLNPVEATRGDFGRWKWVIVIVVVVLVLVVVWMYRRLKQVETKLHHMDRAVEQTLLRHDQALTQKIEQFEKSSSDHRQFMQVKVDELTRTVQEHMNYLRSTMIPMNVVVPPSSTSPSPPSPPTPPSQPSTPFLPSPPVPQTPSMPSMPSAPSHREIREIREEDLDAELEAELNELDIPVPIAIAIVPSFPSKPSSVTIEVLEDATPSSPIESSSSIEIISSSSTPVETISSSSNPIETISSSSTPIETSSSSSNPIELVQSRTSVSSITLMDDPLPSHSEFHVSQEDDLNSATFFDL